MKSLTALFSTVGPRHIHVDLQGDAASAASTAKAGAAFHWRLASTGTKSLTGGSNLNLGIGTWSEQST
ncbi:hypothetical protein [Mesorhizobium sp. B2-3-6]|uniref:hypothetical protein n=1 Tax=Mesorhizobium sp. B2-3-6 TaxID=2589957 RepID=UPI0015E3E40D|nr:hypothetical protein [Mesorhizobium sp. B2-3-6]